MIRHLTPRERECLVLLANGESRRSVERAMQLAPGRVSALVTSAYKRLGVRNRTCAYIALGWLTPPEE